MPESAPRRPRIYPPVYFLLAVVSMIALDAFAPGRQILTGGFHWLGLLPLIAGAVAVAWMAILFRRVGTTIKPFEESSVLLARGPYRVSRNPAYLGMVCGLVGVAVLLGSATPFLVIPVFALLIDRLFIREEERMLERSFGTTYVAYKAAVRRWL